VGKISVVSAIIQDMNEHEPQSAAVAAEVEKPKRVGNTDWCSCMTCGLMPSARESLCCQEMDVLADKRAEAGILNQILNLCLNVKIFC